MTTMNTPASLFGAVLIGAASALITILALKGKYGMIAIGLLVRVCWVVGAIRLAKPTSVWARTFYSSATLEESCRRFPVGPDDVVAPAPARSEPTRRERVVHAALVVGAVLAALVQPAIALLVGPALVFVAFSLAGLRWAWRTTAVLTGLAVLLALAVAVLAAAATGDVVSLVPAAAAAVSASCAAIFSRAGASSAVGASEDGACSPLTGGSHASGMEC